MEIIITRELNKIGKAFVLFKINSSPTAFHIIKPTCIARLVTKVSNDQKIVE